MGAVKAVFTTNEGEIRYAVDIDAVRRMRFARVSEETSDGCVVLKRRVMRDQLLDIVAQVECCTIVVEACTGASKNARIIWAVLRTGGTAPLSEDPPGDCETTEK